MVVRRAGKLIPLDRHPLVVFLVGWAAFSGIAGVVAVLFGDPPGTWAWWVDLMWYAVLGVGAVGVLIGTWWRRPVDGVLIARACYWPTGIGAVLYAVHGFFNGDARAGSVIIAFGLACLWRAVQIRRDVRAELKT